MAPPTPRLAAQPGSHPSAVCVRPTFPRHPSPRRALPHPPALHSLPGPPTRATCPVPGPQSVTCWASGVTTQRRDTSRVSLPTSGPGAPGGFTPSPRPPPTWTGSHTCRPPEGRGQVSASAAKNKEPSSSGPSPQLRGPSADAQARSRPTGRSAWERRACAPTHLCGAPTIASGNTLSLVRLPCMGGGEAATRLTGAGPGWKCFHLGAQERRPAPSPCATS